MSTLHQTTGWSIVTANDHIVRFIENHKEEVLPLSFMSKKITSELYFSPLENFFDEKECNDLYMRKHIFFGQVLTLEKNFLKSDNLTGVKTISLQNKYEVSGNQTHEYKIARKWFGRVKVGELMDLELVNSVNRLHQLESFIGTSTEFFSEEYRILLHKDPVFYRYHLTHFLLWVQKKYKPFLS